MRDDNLLKLILAATCVFLIVFAGCIGPDADGSLDDSQNTGTENGATVTVTNTVDGDTIDVTFANGSTERVRLLGVDTPETHVENQPEDFEGIDNSDYLREWGYKATDYTQKHLHGEEVRLEYDDISDRRGYYGRLLAYVYLPNDTMFNEMLLENGYATVYESANIEHMDKFQELEQEAMENHRGLWKR